MGNGSKVIAIVALLVAVVALAVGFATFSATLTIKGEGIVEKIDTFDADVNYSPDATYPTKCYYTSDSNKTNIITGDIATAGYSSGTASANTWSGIKVPIQMDSADHKSVTCEAQIENASAYVAYLKSITTQSGLTCSSVGSGDDAASSSIVTSICSNSSATVTVGSDSATITNQAVNVTGAGSIIAKSGNTNGTQLVTITIAYTGTSVPDGDVKIDVPTVSLLYKTQ